VSERPADPAPALRVGAPAGVIAGEATVWLAGLMLAVMVVTTGLIVIDGAAGATPIVPASPHIARYLQDIGSTLGFDKFLEALLVFTFAYAGLLACARGLTLRWAIAAIVILNLIVFAGPVLLSQDIFSYLAYARMGVLHGVNPYVHGPGAISSDPIYYFVGVHWKHSATAYGPLFTLISYPIAWLGVFGGLWALKLLGLAASLLMVWMVVLCARRLDRDPVMAALIVGLNPLTLLYTAGGAHNDLLMAALMMVGVYLVLAGREAWGGVGVIAGAMVKATAAVVVPFMALGTRRLAPLLGAIAATAAAALVAYVAFGVHALDFVSVLKRQQSFVSTDSFPNEVAHLFGKAGVYPVDRALLRVGLIVVVSYLAWRVWRGYDWIAGAGWTMLAIAVTTTWLLAWYIVWALPLAAVGRDRRLLVATLAVQTYFLLHQLTPLISPV
jgi:hypothetical protein